MGFIERLPDLQRLGAKNVPAQVLIRIFVKALRAKLGLGIIKLHKHEGHVQRNTSRIITLRCKGQMFELEKANGGT
jgi:hypothetical protein